MWLRRFTKLTCFSTLFLIFAGGMVTSTGSGLSVPDWPLSYGMLFPPMVGGVFYEHGHRMIATCVGLFTLILAFWLNIKEQRKWVKVLGWIALLTVIGQGVLGGLTVLFFLPTSISVSHGVLAQTFFVLTIIIAYSQSIERKTREQQNTQQKSGQFLTILFVFIVFIYLQLIFGAIMRHTHSGLAIPDFPTMGGYWWAPFNEQMLLNINAWRFDHDMDPVNKAQVIFHFLHRLGALIILVVVCFLNISGLRCLTDDKTKQTLFLLNVVITCQILLGIFAVLTLKAAVLTSLHVVNGAAILGISVLLFLRAAPLKWDQLQNQIFG